MTEPLPELTVKVTADVDDAIEGLAGVEAAEKAVGDQSDKTTAKVKKNQKDQGSAVSDFDRLYKAAMKDGQSATDSFSTAIDQQKAKIKDLQTQFKAGGGSTSAFGDLKAAQADLAKLQAIYADIGGESKKIQESTGTGLDELMAALPQMATLAAPFLAPVVAGSLLGLLGAGGLAAGIVANLGDAKVKGAIGTLKTDLSGALHESTSAFVPEIVAGIGELDKGTSAFLHDLKPGLDALAPSVKSISGSLAAGLEKAGPQFANALEKSVPVVDALGDGISTLVVDGGKFLDALTTGTKGEADAIHDLTTEAGDLLVTVGQSLGLLANTYGTLSDLEKGAGTGLAKAGGATVGSGIFDSIKDGAENALNPIHGAQEAISKLSDFFGGDAKATTDAGTATHKTAAEFMGFTTTTDDTTAALNELISTTDTWISQAQGVDDSLLSMDKAQTAFSDQLKIGKKNWDENTKGGQANVGALNSANKSITDYYGKLEAAGPLTQKQTSAELKATEALLAQAKANGATAAETATLTGEVSRLKDQLALIKSKTVQITAEIKYNEHFTASYANGAIRPGFKATASAQANSGVANQPPSYATSGVMTGGTPMAFFAEQSVGREAFVAENGDSNRAKATLREAGDWHGMDMVQRGRGSNTNGGSDQYLTVVIPLDGKVIAKQIIGPVNKLNARSGVSIYGAPQN